MPIEGHYLGAEANRHSHRAAITTGKCIAVYHAAQVDKHEDMTPGRESSEDKAHRDDRVDK